MNEYYAKISHIEKGTFRILVTIWVEDSESKINKVLAMKRFIRYNRAYAWAARKIFTESVKDSGNIFIRQSDILRKEYNG